MDDSWGRVVHTSLPRLFLDHFHPTSNISECDGGLAGFLIGFLSPSAPDTAYIHFASVSPAFAAPGLGRDLYTRFFGIAQAGQRRVVRAIASPRNHACGCREIMSPHATWAYSWIRPPRSRRRTRIPVTSAGDVLAQRAGVGAGNRVTLCDPGAY